MGKYRRLFEAVQEFYEKADGMRMQDMEKVTVNGRIFRRKKERCWQMSSGKPED